MDLRGKITKIPSVADLERDELYSETTLRNLIIESAEVSNLSPDQLAEFGFSLKDACTTFSAHSKHLFNYHLRHGNMSEANELRKTRYVLIHNDVQESIYLINSWLRNHDYDRILNVGFVTISLFQFAPSK